MPILRDFWRKSWNSPNFAMHKIKLNLQDKTKIEILKTKPKSCNNLICKNWKKFTLDTKGEKNYSESFRNHKWTTMGISTFPEFAVSNSFNNFMGD